MLSISFVFIDNHITCPYEFSILCPFWTLRVYANNLCRWTCFRSYKLKLCDSFYWCSTCLNTFWIYWNKIFWKSVWMLQKKLCKIIWIIKGHLYLYNLHQCTGLSILNAKIKSRILDRSTYSLIQQIIKHRFIQRWRSFNNSFWYSINANFTLSSFFLFKKKMFSDPITSLLQTFQISIIDIYRSN